MPVWEADVHSEEVFSSRMALAGTAVYLGWFFKLSLFWKTKNHRNVSVVGDRSRFIRTLCGRGPVAPTVLPVVVPFLSPVGWLCWFSCSCHSSPKLCFPLYKKETVGISRVSNDTHPGPLKVTVKNVLGLWVQSGCGEGTAGGREVWGMGSLSESHL